MAKRWMAWLLAAGLMLLPIGALADVPASDGTPGPEAAAGKSVQVELIEMPISPDAPEPEEMDDTPAPEADADAPVPEKPPAAVTEAPPDGLVAEEPTVTATAVPEALMPQESTEPSANGETAPARADGGRVRFTLTQRALPLTGVKIGIDPGHQARGNSARETVAPNSGKTKAKVVSGTTGVVTRIPEYVTVLEISLKLRDALVSQGAEVYMTRETHDVDLSNQQRAQMMNALGVDLVLRVHCDGASDHSRRGVALYCSRSNSIADESRRAAEAILPRVCEATGAQANGIVQNDDYTGQNWSTVPCVMVECGFLSNAEEDVLLNDEDYQWKIATGLTNGVVDYIAER